MLIKYNKIKQTLTTINDHQVQITSVNFISFDENTRFLTTCEDGTANFYKYEEGSKPVNTYTYTASAAITGCAIHPISRMVLLASQDGTFSFHDAHLGQLLSRVTQFKGQVQIKSVAIHPDGHFAAFGCSDGSVKIWKVSSS